MDSARTQALPPPATGWAAPSSIGPPFTPRREAGGPVSKEKKKPKLFLYYYLHVWAKVQSIIQAPSPKGVVRAGG